MIYPRCCDMYNLSIIYFGKNHFTLDHYLLFCAFQPKSIFIPQETLPTEDDNQGTIKRCPVSESLAKPSNVPPRPPPPRLPPQKPVTLGNRGGRGLWVRASHQAMQGLQAQGEPCRDQISRL